MKFHKPPSRLAGLMVAAVFLTACGDGGTTAAGYPQEAVNEFVEGCEAGTPDLDFASDICQCTIETIQTNYTFEAFQRLNDATQAEGRIPDEVLEITANCSSQISLEKTGSKYPPQVIENFVESCTGGDASMEAACTCAIDRIQSEYSFAEFMKIDRQVQASGNPPEGLTQIMEACLNAPQT